MCTYFRKETKNYLQQDHPNHITLALYKYRR